MGDRALRGSAGSVSSGDFKGFKPKGGDLAQAMLSEIEDILKEYDTDMGKLFSGSQYSRAEATPAAGARDLPSPNAAVGRYLGKRPWPRRDSQLWRLLTGEMCSATGEAQPDSGSLKVVIRNIYRLVASDMAPKFQGLMDEVTDLRKQRELLSSKVEQQRETNHKQMEELEELQSKLRAKKRELNEHKQASKTLDLFEGENAALKMELKNLRGLVEKQEQRRVSHGDMPTPPEAVEVFQVRTSSNEWLKRRNEDLEREVSRWRAENAEKEMTISELREVIKSMSAVESPRTPPPRRMSTSHYRPESFLGPASLPSRSLGDSPALDSQVGAALTLDTPRGRFRSMIMDNFIHSAPASSRRSLTTTLAEDLKTSHRTGLKRRSVQPLMPASENKPTLTSKGSLSPPPAVCFSASKPVKQATSTISPEGTGTGKKAGEDWYGFERFRNIAEIMEGALFELEDLKASWGREGAERQEKAIRLEQLLMQAEERVCLSINEAEGAKNERDNAVKEYRATHEELVSVTAELHGALRKVAHLQSTLKMTEGTVDDVQRQASKVARRLNENLWSAEKEIGTLQKKIAVLESQLAAEKKEQVLVQMPESESANNTKFISEPESIPPPAAEKTPEKTVRRSLSSSRTAADEEDSNVLQIIETPLLPEPPLSVYRRRTDRCSPMSCFNLWNISKPCMPPPKPIYSHELAKSIQAGTWSLRKAQKIES